MLSRGDLFVCAGIALVGLVVGYMVAASGTPVVSTVLPLVFGLVTVIFPLLTIWKSDDKSEFYSERIETAKQLAGLSAIFFILFFSGGIYSGQWHKRYYSRVDLDHLTGSEQPKFYSTAEKWFSTSAYLKTVGATDQVKDVFYSLLLKQEKEFIEYNESLKKANIDAQKNTSPKKKPELIPLISTPLYPSWRQDPPSVPDKITPLQVPDLNLQELVMPKLNPLEKRRFEQLMEEYKFVE